jgi:uncharacterized protein
MLTLSIMATSLAVARFDPCCKIPLWGIECSGFRSITKTKDELSIVCSEESVPSDVKAEKGWRALKVEGPLDFGLTGILSSLAAPLAEAKISIFAISTFDTDYILVKKENLEKAICILGKFCKINRL